MTNRYSFMKLQLDKNAPSTDYDRPTLGKELKEGYFRIPESKTVEHVTREYLISVLTYVRQYLEKKLGKFLTESTRVEFWLTKPIASGDQAQHAMAKLAKEAAERAGFGDDIAKAAGFAENGAENFFGLVEDSVAGLTANLLETNVTTDYALQPGDRILHNPEFEKLGSEKGIGSTFMKDFEGHKQEFEKVSTKRMTLRLDMKNGKKSKFYRPDGKVILSGEDMEWIFKSTINQIKEALSQQLKEARELGGKEVKVNIDSMPPRYAINGLRILLSWNAVARGAVAYGLGKSKITKRLTQNHYGIDCSLPFNKDLDSESEKYYAGWDKKKEKPLCRNCISWVVDMGSVKALLFFNLGQLRES
ncbi:hypothetical protein N0V90_010046 [Kalmusia sp. IMI 367209]|nr:hypothetical protein N0V90_010046 [Kalmusia sp. IMI 367209]